MRYWSGLGIVAWVLLYYTGILSALDLPPVGKSLPEILVDMGNGPMNVLKFPEVGH